MGLMVDFVVSLLSCPTTALGTAVLLLAFQIVFRKLTNNQKRQEPPGPRPLPLLGNLLQLDLKKLSQNLSELSKTYGSVFTVHLGVKKVVVLAGYKTVREALVNHSDQFGDRDVSPIFEESNLGHGILFANGDSWKEMRRFAVSTLRDFGMGKATGEAKILEECEHLIQVFEKHRGAPFHVGPHLISATANVVSSFVYGSRFEYSDPRFKSMFTRANQTVGLMDSPSILLYNSFPRLFTWVRNRQQILENVKLAMVDIGELIKHLEETLAPHSCRGLVDCFLLRKQKKDSGIVASHFTEENMMFTVANLFTAGTDTTATTLRWGLSLMAKYPLIQDKVQEELNRVVGTRQARVDDRKNLPYTDAVIHETQRLANIVPMSLPHKTSQDVTFQGFFIKKDTIVFPLLTSVLYDETEWESPHMFNPSHFLDAEGKFVMRDAFLPFSAGRRACLGESLAKMELFLFFTSLVQWFRFTPPPGVLPSELDLSPAAGLTLNLQLCTRLASEEQSCSVVTK